ncbi:MAG: ArsC/Spx/MgsR family protein [Pseudomonadota bacterium]
MPVALYGLKNCDTCRKARSALDAADIAHTFVDIRADADLTAKIPAWLNETGSDALINRRSTTWRTLDADVQATALENPAAVLAAHPTLIKRPIIETDAGVHVGWNAQTRAALGVA